MSLSEENNLLNSEEHLKAIVYQFLKLYERWAEDRQVFNKNMAAHEKMLQIFMDQLKNFENLESQVKQQLINSVTKASVAMAEKVGENLSHRATKAVDETANKLNKVVGQTITVLNEYRSEVQSNHWKIIAAAFVTTITTSLLIVFLLIPKPRLPFTDDQLIIYNNGHFFSEFWPKLSKKEQKHLEDLANKPLSAQDNKNYSISNENRDNTNP